MNLYPIHEHAISTVKKAKGSLCLGRPEKPFEWGFSVVTNLSTFDQK
jgi:hypothetical protein